MDLVSTVRKEGSRGGRGEFKWSEVASSSHREHYLGHSLMAPVGRWQRGKDLSWYAKSDDPDAQAKADEERREELRRVKEAEEEAMAKALGLPMPPNRNANMEPLGPGPQRGGEIAGPSANETDALAGKAVKGGGGAAGVGAETGNIVITIVGIAGIGIGIASPVLHGTDIGHTEPNGLGLGRAHDRQPDIPSTGRIEALDHTGKEATLLRDGRDAIEMTRRLNAF